MLNARLILPAVLLAGLCLGLTTPVAPSDEATDAQVVKVKAAYLREIARYVEWPAATFAGEKAALVIGVVGADPFGTILDQSVREATARGRPFEIRRTRTLPGEGASPAALAAAAAELRACHLLFISGSERTRVAEIRTMLEEAHVLTVSDIPHFARDGGAVELVLEKDKVRFYINRPAAERAKLRIDSKLLSLARKVYDEPR